MTVIDLRDRFTAGRLTGIPTPRRAPRVAFGDEAWALCRPATAGRSARTATLDALLGSVVVALAAAIGPGRAGAPAGWLWLALLAAWLVSLRASGAYARSRRLGPGGRSSAIWRAGVSLCATLALVGALPGIADTGMLTVVTVLMAAMTLAVRWLADRLGAGARPSTMLVRGDGREVLAFLDQLTHQQALDVVAVQVTSGVRQLPDRLADVAVLPADSDPVEQAAAIGADSLVLVGHQPESAEELRRILWRSDGLGIGTFLVPLVADVTAPRVESLPGSGVPVLGFGAPEDSVAKVAADRMLAGLGLTVLLPALLLIAAAIRLTSPGPVLFRQVRVGRGGRPFEMLKFRTMVREAEALRADLQARNQHAGETLFKIADDPRVTPVGRVLRMLSLDELPQLVNVLRGEMSLVGPRPSLPAEVAHYPLDAHRRFAVRPGLTGLWQVSGRSDVSPEAAMALDTHYVEQRNAALDLRILGRTPKAVVSGDGAY